MQWKVNGLNETHRSTGEESVTRMHDFRAGAKFARKLCISALSSARFCSGALPEKWSFKESNHLPRRQRNSIIERAGHYAAPDPRLSPHLDIKRHCQWLGL